MLLNMLVTILFLEVIISFILFKSDFISPGFIFAVVFFIAAVNLTFNVEYWRIVIVENTLWVVAGGVGMFIIGCLIVNAMNVLGKTLTNKKTETISEMRMVEVDKNFTILIILFYIFVEVVMLFFVRKIALEHGGGGSILGLIGYYNNLAKSSSIYSMPTILNQFIAVCIYMGYVWAYILVNNFVITKKINIRIAVLLGLSCLCGMISGSRGDAIMLLCAMAIMYVFAIRKRNRNKIMKIPVKSLILVCIVVYIILMTFQNLGTLLGRDAYIYQSNEYISIYVGGPLLNLNNCIRRGLTEPIVWGQETFRELNNFIGGITHNISVPLTSSRIYYQANRHNTGNVCTTFYDFYYDFGVKGCLILAFIMGVFSQLVYNKARKSSLRKSGISFAVIFCSMVLFMVARSFFANSLVSFMGSFQLIKVLLIWAVSIRYIEKIKIKI